MADELSSLRHLVYATRKVREMADLVGMQPGRGGPQDRASFVASCSLAFDIPPRQVEEALDV